MLTISNLNSFAKRTPAIETLESIRNDIAFRLNEAATSRHSAMHTGVVATADADVRVMVLRAFDRRGWRLRFHTDARSPKCEVIGGREAGGSPVGALFYDRKAKIQIRCRGTGWIETDTPLADAAWEESTRFARRCYLGDGPGMVSEAATSGLPDWAEGIEPDEDALAPARANFAVLVVELAEADWFYLSNDGHRRAIIDLANGEGRWVAP